MKKTRNKFKLLKRYKLCSKAWKALIKLIYFVKFLHNLIWFWVDKKNKNWLSEFRKSYCKLWFMIIIICFIKNNSLLSEERAIDILQTIWALIKIDVLKLSLRGLWAKELLKDNVTTFQTLTQHSQFSLTRSTCKLMSNVGAFL